MLLITLTNISNLNTSLQVGDMIYVTSATLTNLLNSSNQSGGNINANNKVGFLRKIDTITPTTYVLHIDTTGFTATVNTGEFIMFTKNNDSGLGLSNDDIKGYYMEVRLANNSTKEAELFSLGSEVTESSK